MTDSPSTSPSFEETVNAYQQDLAEKQALLKAALPFIGEKGWTEDALKQGAQHLGLDSVVVWCLFPEGTRSALEFYNRMLDQEMTEKMQAMPLESMKIREKIFWAVRTRLELLAQAKPAAIKAARFLAHPSYVSLGAKLIQKTVHQMWVIAGDTSTDYNFYTKRALLSGVYASTLLYWFRDTSCDHEKTWVFLEKRIENVLMIQKIKPTCTSSINKAKHALKGLLSLIRKPFQ